VRLLVKRDAQGASSNEVTMETSVGRLESLGQVGFDGDEETERVAQKTLRAAERVEREEPSKEPL
jgi:hypothetical protein